MTTHTKPTTTPTPWEIDESTKDNTLGEIHNGKASVDIIGALVPVASVKVYGDVMYENAELIVKAVNAHDQVEKLASELRAEATELREKWNKPEYAMSSAKFHDGGKAETLDEIATRLEAVIGSVDIST